MFPDHKHTPISGFRHYLSGHTVPVEIESQHVQLPAKTPAQAKLERGTLGLKIQLQLTPFAGFHEPCSLRT
jgi:hypothetical protein